MLQAERVKLARYKRLASRLERSEQLRKMALATQLRKDLKVSLARARVGLGRAQRAHRAGQRRANASRVEQQIEQRRCK